MRSVKRPLCEDEAIPQRLRSNGLERFISTNSPDLVTRWTSGCSAMMESTPILFIQGSYSKVSSRDQEIARAKARSHAAKAAHRRRKKREEEEEEEEAEGGENREVLALTADSDTPSEVGTWRAQTPETRWDQYYHDKQHDGNQPDWAAQVARKMQLLTMLYKGNPDPFHALSADVTPRGSQIITFYRDIFLPSAYRSEKSRPSIRQAALADEWSHISDALLVECCLHGLMYAFLTVMAQLSPKDAYSMDLLALKAHSIKSLRHRMQENLAGDLALAHGVLFLYTADVLGAHYDEAAIHRNMLRVMLDDASKMKAVMAADYGFMARLMWLDLQCALSQMSSMLFDLEGWTNHMESPDLQAVGQALQPIEMGLKQDVIELFQTEPLRSIYIHFRHAAVIWLSADLFLQSMGTMVALWVQGWSQVNSARALKYYLELRTSLTETGSLVTKTYDPDEQEFSWTIQCCVTLTMVLVVGQAGNECIVGGSPVFPAYQMVYNELQDIMEVLYRSTDQGISAGKHQDLFLWALFTGAQYERRCTSKFPHPANSWFNRKFRSYAQQMGLAGWSAVKSRLVQFFFVEEIEPNGSRWVDSCFSLPSIDDIFW